MGNTDEYKQFEQQWIAEIEAGNPSTMEKGNRFSCKLITQWLDIDKDDDRITYCDGTADGGIDLAYLEMAEDQTDDKEEIVSGDTWYLVQSKYGSAFKGVSSLLEESQKVIDTLDGKRPKLNSLAQGIKEKLDTFRSKATPGKDRIVLVFASSELLNDEQKRAVQDVQAMGQSRLGTVFNVETVSVKTIFDRLSDAVDYKLKLTTTLHPTGEDLWVGTTRLLDLYEFLSSYKEKTGDLDQIFQKNVRKFLGNRKKVNQTMQKTLKGEEDKSSPRYFGLYNNGITLVVKNAEKKTPNNKKTYWLLHDPYIVNGCQTTRSIWDVLDRQLNSGGSGESQELNAWMKEIEKAVVVTKIAKVGPENPKLLGSITRYTNSQNAVSGKDFISLEDNFQKWAKEMGEKHGIFLEIQRGAWDSQKAKKKSSITYNDHANAFDLLKIFAAGWLSEAGTAFGRNAAFVPEGSIFKKITGIDGADADGNPFGTNDLLAAYHLMKITQNSGFGRGAKEASRRQTKYLFYSIFIGLLKWVLDRGGFRSGPRDISKMVVFLSNDDMIELLNKFVNSVLVIIDGYFSSADTKSIYTEESFQNFNNNVNGYLKWEKIGKSHIECPNLYYRIDIEKSVLQRKNGTSKSLFDLIVEAIEKSIPKK